MLIRFTLTRKDTGAPIPNARIEVEKAEQVGFTDSQGKAEIITYWSGNWMYNITASGYEKLGGTLNNRDIPVLALSWTMLYNATSTPPAPGPSEEIIDRVGTSCSILRSTGFGQSFFQGRHDRNGNFTSRHADLEYVRGVASRLSSCFETPPPPPKTVGEVADEVTTLQKLLNSTVGKIENLGQMVSDIVAAGQKEVQDRIKDVLDLEARIKAWISNTVFELLLKNLDAGTREHGKVR